MKNCDILGLGMFDSCEIRIHPTGSAIARLGTISQGQGHATTFAQILASEIGLPADEIPLALFTFNVGIEIGQIAFVLVVWGLIALLGRRAETAPAWLRALPVYAIGSLAAMWCIERAAEWVR